MSTVGPENETRLLKRLLRWAAFTVIGVAVGILGLSEWFEPMAEQHLYRFLQAGEETPDVRFIDVGPLYERLDGRQPTADLTRLLLQIRELPPSIRPKVLAIDLPILRQSPVGEAFFSATTEQLEFLHTAWCLNEGVDPKSFPNPLLSDPALGDPPLPARVENDRVRVRVGVTSVRMSLDFLEERLPGARKLFATAYLYAVDDVASLYLGTGHDLLPSLGIAAATAVPGSSPAFSRAYRVSPPDNWPQQILSADTWMLVNFSVFPQHVKITAQAGRPYSPTAPLSPDQLARLSRPQPASIWFIGKTHVEDMEDVTSVDAGKSWRGRAAPIRRIYQHGAIAHSYLQSPIRPFPTPLQVLLDIALSCCGFWYVPLIVKSGRGRDLPIRFLAGIAPLALNVALTVAIAFILANWLNLLWLGFFGNIMYAVVESFYLSIYEQEKIKG
jgi:hypothetical protein